MFVFKLCEKNSSVNIRFKIFVMAFRAQKLFGTFEKQAPGLAYFNKTALQVAIDMSHTAACLAAYVAKK